MTSEAADLQLRNTDFSIARILADDRHSRAQTVRDVARKQRRREADPSGRGTNEGQRAPRHEDEKQKGYVGRAAPARTCQDAAVTRGRQGGDYDGGSAIRRTDLTWLQYTRYRPPKLPRRSYVEKRTRRRAGDRPRIPFSSSQLQVLEDRYRMNAYLSRNDVVEMSATLRLPQSKIKIWFQNRRARQRRELLNSTIVTR